MPMGDSLNRRPPTTLTRDLLDSSKRCSADSLLNPLGVFCRVSPPCFGRMEKGECTFPFCSLPRPIYSVFLTISQKTATTLLPPKDFHRNRLPYPINAFCLPYTLTTTRFPAGHSSSAPPSRKIGEPSLEPSSPRGQYVENRRY